jgi:hypothetical protein
MPPTMTRVLVCATSDPAERIKTLPITAGAGADRQIALRLGAGEAGLSPFPDLGPGDQLKALVELAVTTDCRVGAQGDCVKEPYTWSPHVRARVLLAGKPTAKEKERGQALQLAQQSVLVTHARHHHVFTLEAGPVTIPENWEPRENHVIVAIDAYNRAAKPSQVLLIGANEKGGVRQGMARINLVRVRPGGDPPPAPTPVKQLKAQTLPLTKQKRVLLSYPLPGLVKDEQLLVGGFVEASGIGRPYPARLSARVVLADSASDSDLGKEARKIETAFKGEISPHNGSNCVPGATLPVRKVGVLRVTKNVKQTHYVNLVAESADPIENRTDAPLALTRGSLTVTRYPAASKG